MGLTISTMTLKWFVLLHQPFSTFPPSLTPSALCISPFTPYWPTPIQKIHSHHKGTSIIYPRLYNFLPPRGKFTPGWEPLLFRLHVAPSLLSIHLVRQVTVSTQWMHRGRSYTSLQPPPSLSHRDDKVFIYRENFRALGKARTMSLEFWGVHEANALPLYRDDPKNSLAVQGKRTRAFMSFMQA